MFSRSSKKLLKGGQNNGEKCHPGSSVSHGLVIDQNHEVEVIDILILTH